MFCNKCGLKRESEEAKKCSCGEVFAVPAAANEKTTYAVLNVCLLAFVAIMMVVALIAFFVATFDGSVNNYSIVSLYVLCMLLACPTLKVFLDKVDCSVLKKLNFAWIIAIFVSILVMVVFSLLTLGWPTMFVG